MSLSFYINFYDIGIGNVITQAFGDHFIHYHYGICHIYIYIYIPHQLRTHMEQLHTGQGYSPYKFKSLHLTAQIASWQLSPMDTQHIPFHIIKQNLIQFRLLS